MSRCVFRDANIWISRLARNEPPSTVSATTGAAWGKQWESLFRPASGCMLFAPAPFAGDALPFSDDAPAKGRALGTALQMAERMVRESALRRCWSRL